MIIFLYGSDSYRRNKKLKELVQEYRQKHKEMDMLSVDLEDNPDDWLKVKEFLAQPSMFTDSKVAVVKESGSAEEKGWLKVLKSQLQTDKIFVLISDRNEPKNSFNFLSEKPVQTQSFLELRDRQLEFFVRQEMEKLALEFASDAFRFFCAYIASQEEKSWRVVSELQKISLAGFAPRGASISLVQVRSIVNWSGKEDVYFLAKPLLGPVSVDKKLGVLEKLFLQKEEPVRIFNLLAYQANGINALRLADYDVSVKSGGLGYEEALTDFVIR